MEYSTFLQCLLSGVVIAFFGWFFGFKQSGGSPSKSICIVVLGDVGRSPRMQYHALSCAKEGFLVDMVGFGNSQLIQELQQHPSVRLLTLRENPKKPSFMPQIIYYILKTIFLFFELILLVLFKTGRHSYMLVQNPPAIPSLAATWCICFIRRSKLIVDWHNYGYTVLSLALGDTHPLVKISKIYEGVFGRWAAHNICVTQAMRDDLKERWGIVATTLYDRPPLMFQSVDVASRHNLFVKLSGSYDVFKETGKESALETRFSTSMKAATLKEDRPALIISSTSWTEDEDFSILLRALELYDESVKKRNSNLPEIICVITGKGPLKEYYQEIIAGMVFKNVQICTPWLESNDYPKLIGSSDIGVCLHTSSSGLDLPMKVVDMFGCGVPVCAVGFPCLDELVKHGENGLVFASAEELAKQLQMLLNNFPGNQEHLDKFRKNLTEFQTKRWHACWKERFYEKTFL